MRVICLLLLVLIYCKGSRVYLICRVSFKCKLKRWRYSRITTVVYSSVRVKTDVLFIKVQYIVNEYYEYIYRVTENILYQGSSTIGK